MSATAFEGRRWVVTSAIAPLWVSVEAAARFGPFVGTSYTTYQEWVRELVDRETSLIGSLDTVALSGESVEVLEDAGSGLLRVRLPEQPDGDAGYCGFLAAAHVGSDARGRVTHRLTADLAASADGGPSLPAGTAVELVGESADEGEDARATLASGERVSCPRASLRPLGVALGPCDVLEIARGYLGTPYVWGGLDRAGIDCSGLVHIAARIAGRFLPRDAHHQWAVTRADASWDDLQLGDLLYFGERATLDGVDHVGIFAGGDLMLHAPEEGRTVVLEPISERARARALGVGRLPTADSAH